jgi:hypothetical protein
MAMKPYINRMGVEYMWIRHLFHHSRFAGSQGITHLKLVVFFLFTLYNFEKLNLSGYL